MANLPPRPNLDQLKQQAKDLLRDIRRGDPSALAELQQHHPRPVEPNAAKFGAERVNDFIVMSEGNSNAYLIQTGDGNIQVNAGMFYEAKVHERNFDAFSTDPVRYLILTQGHVDHVGGVQHFRDKHPGLEVIG